MAAGGDDKDTGQATEMDRLKGEDGEESDQAHAPGRSGTGDESLCLGGLRRLTACLGGVLGAPETCLSWTFTEKRRRLPLLLPFFLLNVVMIGVDVGLDLASAWKHFASGHVWWGSLTLALAFAPALAVLASIAARRAVKIQVDEDEHYWHHLPGIQVLVNLVSFLELKGMNTDDPMLHEEVEKILASGAELSLHEAFLEAGPQTVLQLSIVIRRGYIGPLHAASIAVSLLALTLSCGRAFFSQRVDCTSDPNPPAGGLALVFSLFLLVTPTCAISWAFIVSHIRGLSVLVALCSFMACGAALQCFGIKEKLLKRLNVSNDCQPGQSASQDGKQEENNSQNSDGRLADSMFLRSILTSPMVPCVAGSGQSKMLAIAGAASLGCLALGLSLAIPAVMFLPINEHNNPPVTQCILNPSNDTGRAGVCLISGNKAECGQPLVRLCSSDCLDSIRYCEDGEEPFLLYATYVLPVLGLALGVSLLAVSVLTYLTAPENLYPLGIIQRGLLFKISDALWQRHKEQHSEDEETDGTKEKPWASERLLFKIMEKTDPETLLKAAARQNAKGNTILHVTAARCQEPFVRNLVENAFALYPQKMAKKNTMGQSCLHSAAASGDPKCLKILLESKVLLKTIDEMDLEGRTILHAAARSGGRDVTKLVLDAAKRVLKDKFPSYVVEQDNEDRTALHWAAQASSAGCIEALRALKDEVSGERLVDLEARDHRRRTALHVAVAEGRAGTVEEAKKTMDTLEALNAHPEGDPSSLPRDSKGQTALHLAAIRGDLDRVHWKDAEGKRFMTYHCGGFFDENRRCARTLLSSRRLLAENADGWTPLEVALQKRNLDCAHAIFCAMHLMSGKGSGDAKYEERMADHLRAMLKGNRGEDSRSGLRALLSERKKNGFETPMCLHETEEEIHQEEMKKGKEWTRP